MVSAPNQRTHANPAWGPGPPREADRDGWWAPPFWHPAGMNRVFGIAATILGFAFWWPIGLVLLCMMKWSGHMGCWGRRQRAMYQDGGYQNGDWRGGSNGPASPFQGWAPWKAWGSQAQPAQSQATPTSGNRAFDEYRAETLRRLEDEQRDFGSFLERLRFAKDKAEFDQFMADRRDRPAAPPAAEESRQP